MNLGELRKSIGKLPPDMNDMEVFVIYFSNGERRVENLCFTGYLPLKDHECIILGTLSEVERMIQNGEQIFPDGEIPPIDETSDGRR